ncbi:MAG: hypothetical protein QM800_01670 [Paludibacter sp.]
MKKFNFVLFAMILLSLNFSYGKFYLTYSLKQLSIPSTIDDGKTVFPTTVSDPNKEYVYNIQLSTNGYNGQLPSMRFSFSLLNGKFSNGKTTMIISYDSLQNGYLRVKWDDKTSNNLIDTAYTAAITLTQGVVVNDPTNFELQKGSPLQISRKIASLKSQTPSLGAGPNRQIGDVSQIVANVSDMAYPGIYETNYGIQTNKKVRYFQWTLPANWETTDGKAGTFKTDIDVKQITVIPDNVTIGSIQVRGVNDIESAYSEAASQYFDRGFSFTSYPASITFGDTSPKTFTAAAFSGITYEWTVPSGWKINGQGNVLEGLNLNSVTITPSFCSYNEGKVQLRLKKNAEVSEWYTCPYAGVPKPALVKPGSIYQYEGANFSFSNLNTSGIQSVNWSGGGVIATTQNGTAFSLFFTQAGTFPVAAEVVLTGCSTPLVFSETVTVNPHRLSISGPSVICSTGTYTLNNLSGATVTWSANEVVSLQPNGNSVIVTKVGAGYFTLVASISVNGSHICNVYSEHVYVPMAQPIVMESVNRLQVLDEDATLFRILNPIPAEAWRYRGQLTVRSIAEYNYTWSKISPATNDVQWTANGATVDVYTRFAEKSIVLQCRGVGPCGVGTISLFTFTTEANPIIPIVMLYPNPATDIVTIELKNNEVESGIATFSQTTSIATEPYTIQLWSERQGLLRSVEGTTTKQQLTLKGLPTGMYFVVLVKDGKSINRQIIWKK